MTGPAYTLSGPRIEAGIWRARLEGPAGATPPPIAALHRDREVGAPSVTPVPGRAGAWDLRLPVPAEIIAEGIETVVIVERGSNSVLAVFSLATALPSEDDLRAELARLRAEFDLLSRAFRRHCAEDE